jgi:hypothetical protein
MRLGLTIARLSAAAWVGAASLFVETALREVRHPGFDSVTKDTLALLRFPAYYAFGFTLVSLALVGALVGSIGSPPNDDKVSANPLRARDIRRIRAASGLLVLVLLMMLADFAVVYRPMADMITPPGRAHLAEFLSYHRVSIWLNVGDVGLCAVAAVLLCWPDCRRDSR